MRSNRLRDITAWTVAAALAAAGARAQSEITAALTGRVTDASGTALPGVTVTIASPALMGGDRSTTSDLQGYFRFPEFAPGIYDLSASLAGFRPMRVEGVTLAVGATANVPLQREVTEIAETLVVTADAVNVDTASSGTTLGLDHDLMQNLLAARFQPDVLNCAPGIYQSVAFGSSEAGIAYPLDGVDASDPEGGTARSFVDNNIVEEMQFVGLGAPAEYGSFSSVVFNGVTKSGGNVVHGLVEAMYTDDSLSDDFSGGGPGGLNPRTESEIGATAQVGGPILRDQLWYFLSARYYELEGSNGGPIRSEESPRAFAKLSWQANPSNDLEAWVEWGRDDNVGLGGDGVTPLEATVTEEAPESAWNLSWKALLSRNTILNVSYGGYDGYYDLHPHNGYVVAGRLDAETGFYNSNSRFYYLADRKRNQVVAAVSHYADDFIKGSHDFKFGMEIERSTLRSRYGYPAGAWFYDNYHYYGDDPGTPDYEYSTYVSYGYYGYGYDLRGTLERGTLFAQDSWKIAPNFTINAGLRAEFNRGKVPGEGEVFDNDALAPRFGFAWDPIGDGRTVVKGHYGRFFEKFVATQFYYANPDGFTPLETRVIYPSGHVVSFGQDRPGGVLLDQDLDQPYLDQYTLGVDRDLPGGIAVSLTYIHREKKDFIETVSGFGEFVPVTGVVNETGETVTLHDYLNPETDLLVYRNVPGLHRDYEGVMLTGTRRFRDNWQMSASYVWSETKGNVDNTIGFNSRYGGDNPGRWLDTPNSLVNAEGRSTHDQTHQVKLQGTYVFPAINLSLSGNYSYHSGNTYTLISRCLLVDDDCYAFNQGTVRYFGENRGSRRLDAKNELDLRAEWTLDVGSGREIGFIVDAFNVTNEARVTTVEDETGSAFETPLEANMPRTYRLGLRFAF